MPSASELIERSRALRALTQTSPKGSKSKKRQPVGLTESLDEYQHNARTLPMNYRVFQVLAPVGFEWHNIVRSYYLGESYAMLEWPGTNIIHGHPRSQITCRYQDQCHVLGYKPTGDEHPNFLERWKKFGDEG